MNSPPQQHADRRFLAVTLTICAVISIGLSAWSIYIDDVVNNDGIEYIRATERLAAGDWSGAFSTWKWPFFPLLMLVLAKVTGVSYLVSGHVLDTVFLTLTVLLFVLTVRAFGGDSRQLTLLAALVALIHPAFNEYRAFIIRDPGYLVGHLVAVYFLAKCIRDTKRQHFVGVLVGFGLASLFRIEGLIFLFFTPVLFLLMKSKANLSHWILIAVGCVAVFVLLSVVASWWLLVPNGEVDQTSLLQEPFKLIGTVWEQIRSNINYKILVLEKHVLGQYSARYAYMVFGLIALIIIVSTVLSQLTVPWFLLVLASTRSGFGFVRGDQLRVWVILLLLHLVILFTFGLLTFVAVDRYSLGFALTALLVVPFVLNNFLASSHRWRIKDLKQIAVAILMIWGIGESVSGLDNVTRHSQVKVAGIWLSKHMTQNGFLVSNDLRLAYYANRYAEENSVVAKFGVIVKGLKKKRWPDAEFIAVLVSGRGQKVIEHFRSVWKTDPVKVFRNDKSGDVLIFKRLL